VVDLAAPMVVDYLPENVRQRANLMPLPQALAQMHFPADKEQVERARRRLGFDEFLFIQLGVLQRKLLWQGERGYPLGFQEPIHEEFLGKLPFDLTGAQVRALEIQFAKGDAVQFCP
jgi:ATP-dependent DNA helicase RecG